MLCIGAGAFCSEVIPQFTQQLMTYTAYTVTKLRIFRLGHNQSRFRSNGSVADLAKQRGPCESWYDVLVAASDLARREMMSSGMSSPQRVESFEKLFA